MFKVSVFLCLPHHWVLQISFVLDTLQRANRMNGRQLVHFKGSLYNKQDVEDQEQTKGLQILEVHS